MCRVRSGRPPSCDPPAIVWPAIPYAGSVLEMKTIRKKWAGNSEHNWMYGTALWRARRVSYRQQHPLCELCLKDNRIVAAEVVHHTVPHKGNWELFVSVPLQSLCKQHHDSIVQSQERLGFVKGCDINGAPLCADRWEKKLKKRIK
jgi:hypothetical protein